MDLHVLRRALAAARNGIIITDANLHDNPIIYCNRAFEQLTGYSQAEILGRNCRFLQQGDRDQPGLHVVRAAIRSGKPCQAQLRNYRKDGTLFWNELSLSPVYEEKGRLTHFVGVQKDITAQKRAEDALKCRAAQQAMVADLGFYALAQDDPNDVFRRATECVADVLKAELCEVLQSANDGMYVRAAGVGWTDNDGRAAVAASEHSHADYAAKHGQPVISDDIASETRFPLTQFQTEQGIVSGICVVIRGYGVFGVYTKRLKRFTTDDANFLQAVANILAVAIERDRAQEQMRRLQESFAQAQRLASMSEIATNIAHEINQPLGAIANYAEVSRRILEVEPLAMEDLRESLANIKAVSLRAGQIVNRVKALATNSAPQRTSLSLNQLVQDVANLMEDESRASGVFIELQLVEPVPNVSADPVMAQQVLVNLIRNATEATVAANPPAAVILVETAQEDGAVFVRIRDSAVQQTPTDLEQLFEPYVSSKRSGMGMGLNISRRIAEAHQGGLWCTKNPDRGLTFHFMLPASSAH